MFVPAEEDAVRDRLYVHVRASSGGSVIRGILNDFFVEALVLAPAGDDVKFWEIMGELGDVDIAVNPFGRKIVPLLLLELLADKKL